MKNKHNNNFYLNGDVNFIIVFYYYFNYVIKSIELNMQIHNKCKLIFNKKLKTQDFNCDLLSSNVTEIII